MNHQYEPVALGSLYYICSVCGGIFFRHRDKYVVSYANGGCQRAQELSSLTCEEWCIKEVIE